MKIEDDEKAFADLSRFMSMADKPFLDRRLVKDLQTEFFRAEKKQFESEGGYGSGGWPKLSRKYRAWKSKIRPGKKILRFDNRLYRSLTSPSSGSILQVEKRGRALSIGTTVPYAIYHQSTKPRRKLPRRALIEFPKKQNIAFEKIVQKAVIKIAKENMKTTWEVRTGAA